MTQDVILFECYQCGKEIPCNEEEGTPYHEDGHEYCERCYTEQFQFDCPICEDYCSKEECLPENTFFYCNHPDAGVPPGFYKVNEFPVFISDMFTATIQEDNVELVSSTIVYKHDGPLELCDYICRDCFNEAGISEWRAREHIRHAINNEVENPSAYRWTVYVSPTYFKFEGKNPHWSSAGVTLIEDSQLSVQQLRIEKVQVGSIVNI